MEPRDTPRSDVLGSGRTTVVDELARRAGGAQADVDLIRWLDPDSDEISTTTYRELHESALRWASLLAGHGLTRGERMVLLSSSGRDFLGAFFGALYLGAVAVPLSTELRGTSLSRPLALYSPRVVVVDVDLVGAVRETFADQDVDANVAVVECGSPTGIGPDAMCAPIGEPAAVQLSDPCLIMSTSGTTGPSRGSLWDLGTLEAWASTYRTSLGYTPADRIYVCTPWNHANALVAALITAVYSGCGIAYASKFSVRGFWRDVERSGSTSTCILGMMVHVLLGRETAPGFAVPAGFRTMLASSVSARAYERIVAEWGIYPVCAYGLTDFGNISISQADAPTPPGSCGRVVPAFDVQLVDEHDYPVPRGEVGQLVVRPREPWSCPSEYFGMPAETVASRRNLWFHTGDLLRQDDDGWLYFAGRIKEAMRYRGENVSAYEVEAAFMTCAEVDEVAVYGVPSALGDDEIVAAIVPAGGLGVVDIPSLVTRAARQLPHYAVPRYVRVVSQLPKNTSHRVTKPRLVEQGLPAGTWDREEAGLEIERNRSRSAGVASA